jgi:hypothetical protein
VFLQSYVVPICLFRRENGLAIPSRLFGTAFFIGTTGIFLTARHVVEAVESSVSTPDLFWGFVVKGDNGTAATELSLQALSFEFEASGKDLCIGKADYKPTSLLRLGFQQYNIWQECASYGYPLNASYGQERGELWMDIRGMRGYIQRTVQTEPYSGMFQSYELNFPFNTAMSGSPVFVHHQDFDEVIAIALGTQSSETTEEVVEDIDDGGISYRVKRVYREHFGRAMPFALVQDWKPLMLGGLTLKEWQLRNL